MTGRETSWGQMMSFIDKLTACPPRRAACVTALASTYPPIYRHCSRPYGRNGRRKKKWTNRVTDLIFFDWKQSVFIAVSHRTRPTSFWCAAQKWYKLHFAPVKYNKRSAWWRTYSFISIGALSEGLPLLSEGTHQLPFFFFDKNQKGEKHQQQPWSLRYSGSHLQDSLIPSRCGLTRENKIEETEWYICL